MKYKIVFVFFTLIVCGNVFSQRIIIDSFPYLFKVDKNEFRITQSIDTIPGTKHYCYNYSLQKNNTSSNTKYALGIRCTNDCCSVLLDDVNKDGFFDIVSLATLREVTAFVLLYNPLKNDFEFNSGLFFLNKDFSINIRLIDTANSIYCDWACDTSISSIWYSSLFQIKNYIRINLGIITNEKDSITGIRNYRGDKIPRVTVIAGIPKVYKIEDRNRYVIDELVGNFYDKSRVKTIETINNENFNYASYWKNNWRNFLKK